MIKPPYDLNDWTHLTNDEFEKLAREAAMAYGEMIRDTQDPKVIPEGVGQDFIAGAKWAREQCEVELEASKTRFILTQALNRQLIKNEDELKAEVERLRAENVVIYKVASEDMSQESQN